MFSQEVPVFSEFKPLLLTVITGGSNVLAALGKLTSQSLVIYMYEMVRTLLGLYFAKFSL